ncbi:PD-(D/E)XK nuclease family protein [bacterium]|nr:PD-(D/E)XK nuclease family protein [bacterium]
MSVLSIGKHKHVELNLPPELVERTDPLKGEFSPSSYSSSECLRKYYYEKILKLTSVHVKAPLVYGSGIHAAVEYFYRNCRSEELSFEEVQINTVQAFVNYWLKYDIRGDAKRTLEGGILTASRYCDAYRDDATQFEDADIEGKQWVPMPNGTMLQVRLDRVAADGDSVGVIDTKTSSMQLTDWYFAQYQSHVQTTLYYWTMEQLLGRCDFIMIDGIMVPPPPSGSKGLPFARRTFMRTEHQVEEAIRSYCQRTDYLVAGLDKTDDQKMDHYYQNQSRCSDYGGCEYFQICKHGMDHPAIGIDFKTPEMRAAGVEV